MSRRRNPLEFLDDYVVLHFVTTGLDPMAAEIVEVGALRVRNGAPVRKIETLINPYRSIPSALRDRTGITDEMLSTSPGIDDILPYILTFIGEDVIVADSAQFHLDFLTAKASVHLGQTIDCEFVDTLEMSRALFPDYQRHRLLDLVRRFGIGASITNQAMDDARLVHQCYERMKRQPKPQNSFQTSMEITDTPVFVSPSGIQPQPEIAPAYESSSQRKFAPVQEPYPERRPLPTNEAAPQSYGNRFRWIIPAIGAAVVIGVVILIIRPGATQLPPTSPLPTPTPTQALQVVAQATSPFEVDPADALVPTNAPVTTEPPSITPTASPAPILLKSGETGEAVKALQQQLIKLGYLSGEADGDFGPGTKSAVKAFQEKNSLDADGIAGEKTLTLINSNNAVPAK